MTLGFVLSLIAAALLGGVVGSLLGLGGGVIVVPVYTIAFGLPVHVAVGTSLVAVVANAAAASTIYLRSRLANLRLALVLATVTAAGSLIGGLVGTSISGPWLVGIFGGLLVGAGILMLMKPDTSSPNPPAMPEAGSEPPPPGGELSAEYYDPAAKTTVRYEPRRVSAGLGLSFVAGNLSGMLGIGGGVVQVPVMNLLFGMPIKASTATSSHIISLTATTGAVVYLARGFVDPVITAITVAGVYLGARLGARLNQVLPSKTVKRVFSLVLFYMAARMLAQAFDLPFFS